MKGKVKTMRKLLGSHLVNFKKNVHVSVRLDRGIYEYIMSIDGNNFSDSLENLVIDHAKLTSRLFDIIRHAGLL